MPYMTKRKIIETADFFGVDRIYAMEMRLKYLSGVREALDSVMGEDFIALATGSFNRVTKRFIELSMDRGEKTRGKIDREIKTLTIKTVEGEITDDMIEAAREYPVENLVDLRRDRCVAFCHDSDSDSMVRSRNGNILWCNVCNRAFDPIGVLMERDAVSFRDAVKQLN